MRAKRFFYMFLAIMVVLLSCGSDNRNSRSNAIKNYFMDFIVGNWNYIGVIDEKGYKKDPHESCDNELLQFNSSGDLKNTINYCEDRIEVYHLFWKNTPQADKYILSDGSGDMEEVKIVFTESNSKMTIYEYEDRDGFYGIVYQKE